MTTESTAYKPANASEITARTLDGKGVAGQIFDEIAATIAGRLDQGKVPPRLATIVIGDDPSSDLYVRAKQRNARQVGMESQDHRLSKDTTTDQLLELVSRLNDDDAVSGILVQQPPPPQIDMSRVITAIDPRKDVDGFHPINAGLVALGLQGGVEPCTPAGIIELLHRCGVPLAGAEAVIVGRSNLVGKPTALLLMRRDATVTLCHTKTPNIAEHTRRADILVAAAGKAGLVTKDMVKPGAAVVDVSTAWVDGKQVGDLGPGVDHVAGWLTPNPGGVGPMTRAMLLKNTLSAEIRRRP